MSTSSKTTNIVRKRPLRQFFGRLGEDLRQLLGGGELPEPKPICSVENGEDLARREEAKAAEALRKEREAEAAEVAKWRRQLDARLRRHAEWQEEWQDLVERGPLRIAGLRQVLSVQPELTPQADGDPEENVPSEPSAPLLISLPAPEPVQELSSPGGDYHLPGVELMHPSVLPSGEFVSEKELSEQCSKLQEVLDSFAVDAEVYDAVVGPRVTQFRVRPGVGVRVEAISSLERNIALGLAAQSVRVQAPIPGEPFVGVEIPNRKVVPINLRSILESHAWKESRDLLPIILGMDISGKMMITDLTKAPHLLIAGSTGSGKSVCMNAILLSLLYRFTPEELEIALVDPKKVEFALYRQVPHLIHPVVTETKQVVGLLKWMVEEMERRYALLAERQVRNIAGYNEKARSQGFRPLPYLVLVVDELADLMFTVRADIESLLARLAQLSRAAGIHTILATQRPSVNVLTGVIKANFPTRIAFRVSSQIDSRTILDTKGAESLLGRGDMLFNPPGIARLLRVQGPMVEDEEIMRVVEYVARQGQPRYRIELPLESEDESETEAGGEQGDDPLIRQALEVIAQSQRATTSYLQRRLRIGYNRAATLMEELEERGYIGPQVGTNPREILFGKDGR